MTLVQQEIPMGGSPVRFGINLSGVRYELTFLYRNTDIAGGCGWTVDIADTFGNPILCGVPLVNGANLLAQYGYLALGGGLLVATDGGPLGEPVPTFHNLGTDSHIYWVTNAP